MERKICKLESGWYMGCCLVFFYHELGGMQGKLPIRGKEHPVERLAPRNEGEQPGTSPTAMSKSRSIADSSNRWR